MYIIVFPTNKCSNGFAETELVVGRTSLWHVTKKRALNRCRWNINSSLNCSLPGSFTTKHGNIFIFYSMSSFRTPLCW